MKIDPQDQALADKIQSMTDVKLSKVHDIPLLHCNGVSDIMAVEPFTLKGKTMLIVQVAQRGNYMSFGGTGVSFGKGRLEHTTFILFPRTWLLVEPRNMWLKYRNKWTRNWVVVKEHSFQAIKTPIQLIEKLSEEGRELKWVKRTRTGYDFPQDVRVQRPKGIEIENGVIKA